MTHWLDRFRGLVMASAVLAIVMIASARGLLTFVNGPVYDWMSMVNLRSPQAEQSPVILIDVEPIAYHADPALWESLLAALLDMEAKQLALLEPPARLTPAAYNQIQNANALVGASNVTTRHALPTHYLPQPIANHGVFRHVSLTGADEDIPNLLSTLIANHTQQPLTATEIYPNFLAGSNKPPRISAARLLAGEIPGNLIQGRTVVLAPLPADSSPALFTPGGRGSVRDAGGFHARALHSAITNRYLLRFPFINLAGLLVVLAVGCLYFYQRVNLRLSVHFTATVVVVSSGLTFALLHYLYVMFPLTETIATVLGMWITVLNRKYIAEQQGMLLELSNISKLMQKRLVPEDLLHSEEYWTQIGRMVQQLLRLERSIFLETIPGQRRLQEIHAINCDLTAIDERRRDYERTPYTTALRARAPIPLDNYLKNAERREQQYLVPLQVEGEVLGFWAFALNAAEDNRFEVLRVANRLAGDIAELLAQRKQIETRSQREQRRWLDYLALQGGRSLANDLKDALQITTKRLHVVEDLFSASQTAFLLYDPFGQLLIENQAAARLCALCEIDAYDLSYTDTLSRFTGLDAKAARAHLQQVFFTGRASSLPLHTDLPDISGMVSVAVLDHDEAQQSASADHSALQHSGVILEVRLGQQTAAAALPAWIARAFAQQTQQRDPAVSRQVHRYLSNLEPEFQHHELPSLNKLVEELTAGVSAVMRKKRVTLRTSVPGNIQVLLPKAHLKSALEAIFDFAVTDAKRGSAIQLEASVEEAAAKLRLRTDGIGIPHQTPIPAQGSAQPSSAEESAFGAARELIERYGGSLTVSSEVGMGSEVLIELPALAGGDEG